jgi:hypothetical protein
MQVTLTFVTPVGQTQLVLEVYKSYCNAGRARDAGNVQNTSLVPAEKLTSDPEFEEARTVALESVVPEDV